VSAVPKDSDKCTEHLVKRAMQNIMMGKSVLLPKTDLTQVCNNTTVRKEAVNRLVAADLLQHRNEFLIEPSRSKKEPKKGCKRLLREGWLK
jgi:dsRNA-specific ribonuclease